MVVLIRTQPSPDFRATYFGELMRQVFDENPELVTFKGRTHEDLIAEFQQVDRRRIELARAQVAASHHAGLPRAGGGAGEIGILTTEFKSGRARPRRGVTAAALPHHRAYGSVHGGSRKVLESPLLLNPFCQLT